MVWLKKLFIRFDGTVTILIRQLFLVGNTVWLSGSLDNAVLIVIGGVSSQLLFFDSIKRKFFRYYFMTSHMSQALLRDDDATYI